QETRRMLPRPAGLCAGPLHRFGDRALGEDAAEMRLVLDRALQVRLDVDAVRGLLRGGLDRRRVESLADQRGLDALGAHRLRARAGDADAGLGADALLVERHRRADADDGEARCGMGKLHVRGARARGEQRYADLGEELSLLERRRHEPEEPLVHADLALAL